MGLDISSYNNVKKIENAVYDFETDTAVDKDGNKHNNVIHLYENLLPPVMESRVLPFSKCDTLDVSESKRINFSAGGYGSYNGWRNYLAILAGYKNEQEAWDIKSGPFKELIYFSDCEGVIGTNDCVKLYNDFVTFQEKANKEWSDRYFYLEKYNNFKDAFKHASDNGIVHFH